MQTITKEMKEGNELYNFVLKLLKMLLGFFGKVNVANKEILPKDRPFVIACTHSSWLDVIYLGTAVFPSPIHFMAKKQLFENKFASWFLKKLNAFPVDRENPGTSVLKIPGRLLSEGKIVGIFPSGTRNNEQAALKQGAIIIAQRSNVPVIPAAFNGPKNLKELFSRKKPNLIFGEPIYVTSKDKEGRNYFTNFLEEKMNHLSLEVLNK